jgi:hypothetical protein
LNNEGDLDLVERHAQTYFYVRLIRAEMPRFIVVAGQSRSTSPKPRSKPRAAFNQAVLLLLRCHLRSRHPMPGIRKGQVMSKRENNANNVFRPSDSPLTEYEKEQIALRKNLERLKAERLAREAASSKND